MYRENRENSYIKSNQIIQKKSRELEEKSLQKCLLDVHLYPERDT